MVRSSISTLKPFYRGDVRHVAEALHYTGSVPPTPNLTNPFCRP